MDPRPIGVFDSGVGGLTVLHECLVTLPHEDFLYFGDSAPERFPVRHQAGRRRSARFAHEVALHLIARDVKLLVVACNSATAAALPDLQREFDGAADRRDHARGARRRAGHPRPPGGRDGDRGDGRERPLPGGDRACSTPASRSTQVACPELVPLIQSGDVTATTLHGRPSGTPSR